MFSIPCRFVVYFHRSNLHTHNFHALTCQENRCMVFSGWLLVGLRGVASVSWHYVSDGLAANRRLFRLHGTSSSELIYKVSNPYSENRDLYFVSDPPHLIKMVRNAWFNKKRHLWVSIPFYTALYNLLSVSKNVECCDKEISLDHLMRLYQRNRADTGLALILKLKYKHLHLTTFSKMRVDLAAQVRFLKSFYKI